MCEEEQTFQPPIIVEVDIGCIRGRDHRWCYVGYTPKECFDHYYSEQYDWCYCCGCLKKTTTHAPNEVVTTFWVSRSVFVPRFRKVVSSG